MLAVDATQLIREANEIISRAEAQHRDLSDFEAGQCDALIEIAARQSSQPNPLRRSPQDVHL